MDDAHWLDSPSARFLAYLADRLEDAPILLVVALRPKEPGAPGRWRGSRLHPDATILRPAPLSEAAVTSLADEALPATPERRLRRRVSRDHRRQPVRPALAAGGPGRRRIRPDDAAAAHLHERVPADVGRALRLRLEGLPESAARLARAVAVLGDGCALYAAAAWAGSTARKPPRWATCSSGSTFWSQDKR